MPILFSDGTSQLDDAMKDARLCDLEIAQLLDKLVEKMRQRDDAYSRVERLQKAETIEKESIAAE